ncbi:MAG: NADH-quinone oxidoreductase subunit C [Candidatus Omnitrophota bacterium]|nr:NADH-quinone oxidoreductase subunit C [Candidatus Omnitrophota bacterium]
MSAPSLSERLKAKLPGAVLAAHAWRGDETVTVRPESLLEAARLLKEDPEFQMNFLMDLSAVDYQAFGKTLQGQGAHANTGIAIRQPMNVPTDEPWPGPATTARFEVVYHFFSLPLKRRIRLKVPVEESKPEVDSLVPLWAAANWFEREVWDMYGIRFRGHPDLKRILMYPEFEGHPLRKDYPVNKRQPLIGPVN